MRTSLFIFGVVCFIGGSLTFLYSHLKSNRHEARLFFPVGSLNNYTLAVSSRAKETITVATNASRQTTPIPVTTRAFNLEIAAKSAVTLPPQVKHVPQKLSASESYVTSLMGLGRLGNDMFRYAGVFVAALRHNLTAAFFVNKVTPDPYLTMLSAFRLSSEPYNDSFVVDKYIQEPGFGIYTTAVLHRENFGRMTCIKDYLQSFKYFEGYESVIRSEFSLTERYANLADDFLRRLASGHGEVLFVAVHNRRGDMVDHRNYKPAPITYIVKAMDYFRHKYGNSSTLQFVVASNDVQWTSVALAANYNRSNVEYTNQSPIGDMAILSRCNHSIITLGSYGWWLAWLAGGEVVYFRDFIPKTSPISLAIKDEDYYPPSWIGMT